MQREKTIGDLIFVVQDACRILGGKLDGLGEKLDAIESRLGGIETQIGVTNTRLSSMDKKLAAIQLQGKVRGGSTPPSDVPMAASD